MPIGTSVRRSWGRTSISPKNALAFPQKRSHLPEWVARAAAGRNRFRHDRRTTRRLTLRGSPKHRTDVFSSPGKPADRVERRGS